MGILGGWGYRVGWWKDRFGLQQTEKDTQYTRYECGGGDLALLGDEKTAM